MASLPVPAQTYFNDFSFDLMEYVIKRDSKSIGSFQGLPNKDESGKHIAFLMDAAIKSEDVLISGNISFVVKSVDYDTYNGKPELIKAYF